ncbi:MAG: nicotinate (nicotinamide) nucleotide adenylyltransferase [Verrucomicrobiota bacterium]
MGYALQKIGLFGGTFDPPHLGHTQIAQAAVEQYQLDRVIFIPCKQSPLKRKAPIARAHRIKMLELAVEENEKFEISCVELERKEPSFSYLTIEYFHQLYPETELFWIIGSDQWKDLPRWRNLKRMASTASFIVYPRPRPPMPRGDAIPCLHLKGKPIDISATMIRQRLRRGQSIRPFLAENVYRYIVQNKIYEKT